MTNMSGVRLRFGALAGFMMAVLAVAGVACSTTTAARSSAPSTRSATSAPGSTSTTGGARSSQGAQGASTPPTVRATSGGEFCNRAANVANLNLSSSANGDGNAASLKSRFDQAKSDEAAVLATAPDVIKGDLQTIFSFSDDYMNELASVGYDATRIPQSFSQGLEARSAGLNAASNRVTVYLQKQCGIAFPQGSPTGSGSHGSGGSTNGS